jgi:hypothetical protein
MTVTPSRDCSITATRARNISPFAAPTGWRTRACGPRSGAAATPTTIAETINGPYQAEVIYHLGPWKGLEDVELATLGQLV